MKASVTQKDYAGGEGAGTSTGGLRILITDDSAAMRALVRGKLLELADDSSIPLIEEAESGEQALRVLAREPFDLVFLDVEMPGMDGLETCRRIKELSGARVAILSSLTSGGDHMAGRDAGCDNYLTKPPNDRDLKVILRLVSIRKMAE